MISKFFRNPIFHQRYAVLEHQQKLVTLIHRHLTEYPSTLTKIDTGIINTNSFHKNTFGWSLINENWRKKK